MDSLPEQGQRGHQEHRHFEKGFGVCGPAPAGIGPSLARLFPTVSTPYRQPTGLDRDLCARAGWGLGWRAASLWLWCSSQQPLLSSGCARCRCGAGPALGLPATLSEAPAAPAAPGPPLLLSSLCDVLLLLICHSHLIVSPLPAPVAGVVAIPGPPAPASPPRRVPERSPGPQCRGHLSGLTVPSGWLLSLDGTFWAPLAHSTLGRLWTAVASCAELLLPRLHFWPRTRRFSAYPLPHLLLLK